MEVRDAPTKLCPSCERQSFIGCLTDKLIRNCWKIKSLRFYDIFFFHSKNWISLLYNAGLEIIVSLGFF